MRKTNPSLMMGAGVAEVRADAHATTPNVAVAMVTWNRKEDVSRALEAVSRQDVDRSCVDVVVVDNASSDGTLEHLRERWRPERVVENPTARAHEPAFVLEGSETGLGGNLGGFRSLTIIRNADNLGGCGGFNTALSYIWDVLDAPGSSAPPDFAWLVDDDIDLPADALRRLLEAASSDRTIGLVGSRTVDLGDRETTIESTIYLDPRRGVMGDEPARGHRLHASHGAWISEVGGSRGRRVFTGLREVDIVSACSMLARWKDVREVGLWDARYFIYCDDADWCVRFRGAGRRVVLSLDAVVFHTPWHHKLTPARLYYAQRNLLWMLCKSGLGRMVLARRAGHLLREALKASAMRRAGHAEIILRSVRDAALNRGGKLDDPTGKPVGIVEALERAGALRSGARVVGVCHRPGTRACFSRVRALVREELARRGRSADEPAWTLMLRSDMPADVRGDERGVTRIDYSASRRSRVFRQIGLLARPARVLLIFDNANDVPVLLGGWNLHVDGRSPEVGRLERDGAHRRLWFAARVLWVGVCAAWFVVRRGTRGGVSRYG